MKVTATGAHDLCQDDESKAGSNWGGSSYSPDALRFFPEFARGEGGMK